MTTIIKPNQQRHEHHPRVSWFFIIALAALFTMTGMSILFYNDIVDLTHQVREQGKVLEQEKLVNIEFKNQLYQLLDAKHLMAMAAQLDLVEVKNPEFLPLAPRAESLTSVQ